MVPVMLRPLDAAIGLGCDSDLHVRVALTRLRHTAARVESMLVRMAVVVESNGAGAGGKWRIS